MTGCFDPKQCLNEREVCDLFCQNKINNLIISQDVTKFWSISYEMGTQHQRDQCQNFSLGHNFCDITVGCCQINKKMTPKNYQLISHQFGMSPRIGLYHL